MPRGPRSRLTTGSRQRQLSPWGSSRPAVDGTFFKRDIGGKGLKLRLYSPTRIVAQDEGHFSSERKETHWVPNTSAAIDSKMLQLDSADDIDEGTEVRIRVCDDKDLTDPITGWYELRS